MSIVALNAETKSLKKLESAIFRGKLLDDFSGVSILEKEFDVTKKSARLLIPVYQISITC